MLFGLTSHLLLQLLHQSQTLVFHFDLFHFDLLWHQELLVRDSAIDLIPKPLAFFFRSQQLLLQLLTNIRLLEQLLLQERDRHLLLLYLVQECLSLTISVLFESAVCTGPSFTLLIGASLDEAVGLDESHQLLLVVGAEPDYQRDEVILIWGLNACAEYLDA